MEILKAILLGIVQGLTEFLPVSSSGHIELGQALLDYKLSAEDEILFSIVVHCATVLSTIVVFREEIWDLLKGIFKFEWNEELEYATKIVLSMIPVAVIGVLFKDEIEALFTGKIVFVGCMLWITAVLLFFTKYAKEKETASGGKEVNYTDAILIGLAQAFAVLPGVSRSGSTIAIGLLLGVDKSKIAKFSFLMVLAPILGITLLDLKDLSSVSNVDQLGVAFIAAFISGWAACTWMLNIVKQGKLTYFAIYCAIVGTIAILTGVL